MFGVVLVLGAVILATLLVRLAFDVTSGPTDLLGRLLVTVTAPFTWPLVRVLGAPALLADSIALLILTFLWLATLGVARGWEHESRRYSRLPRVDRP